MGVDHSTTSAILGTGSPEGDLSADQLRSIVFETVARIPRKAKFLAILPDKTRDDNTHILFPAAVEALKNIGVKTFDALIAQGTHAAMSDAEKLKKTGLESFEGTVFDHRWSDAESLIRIGDITAEEVMRITNGLYTEPIPLTVNHLLAPGVYDVVLIFGATVPHEVAGFAGGAKYFFPGVAGAELTHKTHWLAALAGIENIIGRVETPTRHLIEAAADHIAAEVITFTSVCSRTDHNRLRTHALFTGDYRDSLRQAAEVSRKVHIKYTGRTYKRVVALLDEHYKDLWVGGKASYRLGGIIKEGGELIIYAPQLTRISQTHGEAIEQFGGYAPLEKVKELVAASGELQQNLCVAAHLAHVSFAGRSNDPSKPRYQITLATSVDESMCEAVNLGYMDPSDLDISRYEGDPDTLIVERAGRDLYLVKP